MKITIEGASEEFERKLLDLLAEHRHELAVTADTEWTVERAERYLRSLPAGARRFAEMVVVDGDGYADADTLRSVVGKLNGPTVALSRAIPRGVREGWWPEGTTAPITVVYDPENPSWQKAKGYEMTGENVPVFRAAIARMAIAKGAAESLGLTPGGTGKTSVSFTPDAASLGGYTPVDLDGGSLPTDEDEDEDDSVMQCHVCLQPYEVDEEGNASHLDTARDADHTPRS
ncbi:hypothetical protein [Kitasatospora cinereorecta]|uniref:Uncharacterized protein n=1 Tax=Kitasatospora cinereorecta TaxID=285560 RepID=A0ABW0VCJ9_9ACTN